VQNFLVKINPDSRIINNGAKETILRPNFESGQASSKNILDLISF